MNRAISAVLGGLALSAVILIAPACADGRQDLRSYYPNPALSATQYLSGQNYLPDPTHPTRSVLWFEAKDAQTYRMYNSDPASPQARCHWDQLSWGPQGYLRYVKTVDTCTGSEVITDFSAAPITFLPLKWDDRKRWTLAGSAPVTHSVDGFVHCTGSTAWVAQILGWEQLTPRDRAIHWRTTQVTNWTTGTGDCAAGTSTRWREDYWLTQALPSRAGPAKGLKRTTGGSLDSVTGNWDVWMNTWMLLR